MLKKQTKKHNHVINIYSTPKRFISHIQMKCCRIVIFCFNSSNDNNFGKYLAIGKYLAVICDLKIVLQLNTSSTGHKFCIDYYTENIHNAKFYN